MECGLLGYMDTLRNTRCALATRYRQNGFTTAKITIAAIRIAGISLIRR